ncbi:MAG TPA: hypothetical protein VEH77_18340, partial [Roseiarcus sp.]|nr:hypothetical protein [Roseiarcus sp.]
MIRHIPLIYERQCQWDIEEVFRMLKSDGLALESTQVETASRLFRCSRPGGGCAHPPAHRR